MKRLLTSLVLLGAVSGSVSGEDWYRWRGPEQTGVSREKDLPDKFSTDPKDENGNLLWKQPYGSRSTPIVMKGKVYLINNTGEGVHEQERVMCLDANDGKLIWEHKFNVFHTDIVSVRLGWTNLDGDPETGNIYAHGTQGLLFCFDGSTGKVIWSHSLTEEYGRISGYGGRVTSPTVIDNLVVVGMLNSSWGEQARNWNRVAAFDKRTGSVVWWAITDVQPRNTYYSGPVVGIVNGEKIMILGGAAGDVNAYKVNTGEKVWTIRICEGAINCTPVMSGSRVYVSHGEENLDSGLQGGVFCLDAGKIKDGKPEVVWKALGFKAKYSSPAIHDGRIYVSDEVAKLYCIDADTGKMLWPRPYAFGRNNKGSPVWADGKLFIADVNSRFHILKPEATQCTKLHTQFFQSPDGIEAVELNGSPAITNGRVYFTTSQEIYCLGKKNHTAKADPIPPAPREAKPARNAKPAMLLVEPNDIVMTPGSAFGSYQVKAYDEHGHWLKDLELPPVQWSLGPMQPPPPAQRPPAKPGAQPTSPSSPPPLRGVIRNDGGLSVDIAVPYQAGTVVAKAAGLTAFGRVRVVRGEAAQYFDEKTKKPLPYAIDFSKVPDGRTPAGWINCQGKFEKRTLKDGTHALVKLANIANPLVARANAYFCMPNLTGYTIESDIMATIVRGDMPDLGIVANRYTLLLNGNTQRLRIVSWDAVPRVDKGMDWKWSADKWYSMKLTVDVQSNKALVRGKVWPKGEQQPEEWTIEFEDPNPNREGSPALYGYATGITETSPGSECFFANVKLSPNK